MIVVDASAIVALLTDESHSGPLIRAELARDAEWAAPEHLVIEAASAFRGLWLGGHETRESFDARLSLLGRMEFTTFPTGPLLPRIRELASNATAYDAAYLALAERLQIPLITVDRKLARVPGALADIRLIAAD